MVESRLNIEILVYWIDWLYLTSFMIYCFYTGLLFSSTMCDGLVNLNRLIEHCFIWLIYILHSFAILLILVLYFIFSQILTGKFCLTEIS